MILTVVLAGVVLGALYMWKMNKKRGYHLPPGPQGLPWFGNVFQLDKQAPHKTITEWGEEYGDVFKFKMFGNDIVVLNSHETIYEALVTKGTEFAGRPGTYRTDILRRHAEDVAYGTYSKEWVFRKKAAMQALKMYGDNLENLERITLDQIQDMNEELSEAAEATGTVNVKPIMRRCITNIITAIMYGHKVGKEDVSSLLNAEDTMHKALEHNGVAVALDMAPILRYVLRDTYNRLIQVRDMNETWFKREINNRRNTYEEGHPQCVADALFEIQRKGRENNDELQLTDNCVYAINTNILFAGTLTTSLSVTCLIAIMVNRPTIQKKMADEILDVIGTQEPRLQHRSKLPYIEATILELLRYTSILPTNLPHYTIVDVNINGYDIPKGTLVRTNLWNLHHNTKYWDEPWEFKPERFLEEDGTLVPPGHPNRKRLLPFGASRRVCIGETLARNRIFLMTASLLQHFQFLPESEDKRPSDDPRTYSSGAFLTPSDYSVKLLPRNTSN